MPDIPVELAAEAPQPAILTPRDSMDAASEYTAGGGSTHRTSASVEDEGSVVDADGEPQLLLCFCLCAVW